MSRNPQPAQFLTLYHGTHTDAVEHIRSTGLQTPAHLNPYQWPTLTDSRDQAHAYAHGESGAVVKFHVPVDAVEEHLTPAMSHTAYGYREAKAYGVRKPLREDWIAGVDPVDTETWRASRDHERRGRRGRD